MLASRLDLWDCVAVVIRFQPTGNAPILKQKFRKITASEKFQTVIQFLRKELALKSNESLVSRPGRASGQSPQRPRLQCMDVI